jgi:anti-anti-sigma factor
MHGTTADSLSNRPSRPHGRPDRPQDDPDNIDGAEADTTRFSVTSTDDNEQSTVTVHGELDPTDFGQLRQAVELAAAIAEKITIDLRSCSAIDSRGVRELLILQREMDARGRTVCVGEASPTVARILEATHTSVTLRSDHT